MRYFWFVIFVLSVGSVSAQNSARVRELEKQRKAALAEIEMTKSLHIARQIHWYGSPPAKK